MRISIITPAYNAAKFLAKTLESVLAQTMNDWELIIVDDGSADDTLGIARMYATDKRIRVVVKENGGVATARNFGYAHTDIGSEFVIFLDHDDVWKPETLQVLIDALGANPNCVAAHGLARQTDLQGSPSGIAGGTIHSDTRRKPKGSRMVTCSHDEPTTFAMLICHCYISTPGTSLIRRGALEGMLKLDGKLFRQEAAPADDWDFWLRLSALGDIAYLDEVVIDWRVHESNGSHDDTATFAAEWRVRRAMLDCENLSAEQSQSAQYRYRRMYATVLRHNVAECRRNIKANLRKGRVSLAIGDLLVCADNYASYINVRKLHCPLDRLTTPPPQVAVRSVTQK